MDKYQAALRTASAIFHLGWNSLSLNEEIALQNNSEFRERVEEYIARMKNGESAASIERFRSTKCIILDQPSMEYARILNTLKHRYEHVHVDFLCGNVHPTSHFTLCVLKSSGNITYRCLNIPINEWKEWKERPEYQGE